MNKKTVFGAILTMALTFGVTTALMADVPPPPVNQTIGFPDTKFDINTRDCSVCHGSGSNVDRHHNLITTVVPSASCIRQAGLPANLVNGCHVMVSDGSGGFVFQDFRTCTNCHGLQPHHTSARAMAENCAACHKSVIDNPGDGHFIPTYAISSVTPLPGGKTVIVPGSNPPVNAIVQGCEACHQADPSVSPLAIFSNADTHHGTGIGLDDDRKCNWCHNVASGITIRQCEACHGVKSLHNIQVNTPATANLATIVPGAEIRGYGHIGNNTDCQGCHTSIVGSSSPFSAAIVPYVKGQSTEIGLIGKETSLTLTGSAFTNVGGDGVTVYNPKVSISGGTTNLSLEPFSVTESEIKVLVPALPLGNYEVTVTKEGVESNLAKLIVIPEVLVKSAVLGSRTSLTITGQNFGTAPSTQYNSGLGVYVGTQPAKIVSWSNSKIVASSPGFKAGAKVVVQTLYGKVSGTISGAVKKGR